MTTKKPALTAIDACLCIHTALRKVCDSPQTSALYNVVHLMPEFPPPFHPWRLYGELVARHLETGLPERSDAVLTAAMRLEDEWFARIKPVRDREPEKAGPALYAIVSLFKLMTAEDWACMAAYL